jgi:hypothetical protein
LQRLHQTEFIFRAGTGENIKFLRGFAELRSSITSSSRPVMALPALPIPSILPILIAVCGWSPVIIFTRIPPAGSRQSP